MTDLLLTIDPGECTGLAWGVDRTLVACAAATPGDDLLLPAALAVGVTWFDNARCVIEIPKFYGAKAYGHPAKATAIANALIRESLTAGGWIRAAQAAGFAVDEELPRTWKGTVKKKAMCMRIIARMTRDERKMVSATLKQMKLAPSKTHNVLDAIGMFFWKVGRL